MKRTVRIATGPITIETIRNSSGLFSGQRNVIAGRLDNAKSNEAFGRMSGRGNRMEQACGALTDRDELDRWAGMSRGQGGNPS